MATITIKMDLRRANKKGEYPVKLIIISGNTSAAISLSIALPQKAWIGDGNIRPVKESYPASKMYNDQIEREYLSIRKKFMTLETDMDMSKLKAADIKTLLLAEKTAAAAAVASVTKTMGHSLQDVAQEFISERGKSRTKEVYRHTLKVVTEFAGNNLTFEMITEAWLDKFNRWMTAKEYSINTRSIHLRNLRAIFNYAILNRLINDAEYPFKRFKIRNETPDSQFLTPEQVRTLYELQLPTKAMRMARDYWMLLFFFCGISPVDLFNMKKAKDKDGRLSFSRIKIAHKTQNRIRLTPQPEAQTIIERYKSEEDSEYLLDFERQYISYDVFKSSMSQILQKIAAMLGYGKLNMYLARHTWATIADSLDISDRVIAKALGHADKSIAGKHYISFDWGRVDAANRRVIDAVIND